MFIYLRYVVHIVDISLFVTHYMYLYIGKGPNITWALILQEVLYSTRIKLMAKSSYSVSATFLHCQALTGSALFSPPGSGSTFGISNVAA